MNSGIWELPTLTPNFERTGSSEKIKITVQ